VQCNVYQLFLMVYTSVQDNNNKQTSGGVNSICKPYPLLY